MNFHHICCCRDVILLLLMRLHISCDNHKHTTITIYAFCIATSARKTIHLSHQPTKQNDQPPIESTNELTENEPNRIQKQYRIENNLSSSFFCTTNYQLPTTNYRLPSINYQSIKPIKTNCQPMQTIKYNCQCQNIITCVCVFCRVCVSACLRACVQIQMQTENTFN